MFVTDAEAPLVGVAFVLIVLHLLVVNELLVIGVGALLVDVCDLFLLYDDLRLILKPPTTTYN